MPDGLRAAAAGLMAQQMRLEALAGDVANVSTPGYRRERLAFRDLVGGAGTAAGVAGKSVAAGSLTPKDDPFALAITNGTGFFQVRLADGQIGLTRSGDFRLDQNRDVVTSGGLHLVPPIKVPANADPTKIKVGADGTVTLDTQRLGKIDVVTVPAPGALQVAGEGVYTATAASGAARAVAQPGIQQGVLESSNVDLGTAMVDMIDAQRAFQLASRALKLQDQLREIANGIKR
jgi:flagellar basal-body rod protein FlgG